MIHPTILPRVLLPNRLWTQSINRPSLMATTRLTIPYHSNPGNPGRPALLRSCWSYSVLLFFSPSCCSQSPRLAKCWGRACLHLVQLITFHADLYICHTETWADKPPCYCWPEELTRDHSKGRLVNPEIAVNNASFADCLLVVSFDSCNTAQPDESRKKAGVSREDLSAWAKWWDLIKPGVMWRRMFQEMSIWVDS